MKGNMDFSAEGAMSTSASCKRPVLVTRRATMGFDEVGAQCYDIAQDQQQ